MAFRQWAITKAISKMPFGDSLLDALDVFGATPGQVGAGVALGIFVALAPPNCGLTWLVLFIAGMTAANLTATVITGVALKPLSIFLLDQTAWELGRAIDEGSASGVISKLVSIPGVALLGLDRYHVMGAFAIAAIAALPVYLISRTVAGLAKRGTLAAIAKAREKLHRGEKLEEEEREMAEKAEKRRVPFRLKLVALAAMLLVAFDFLLLKPIVSLVLQKKLPLAVAAALGTPPAKVEWKSLDCSLVRGNVEFEDLRVADPKNPDQDLFRAARAKASFSPLALLAKKVSIDTLALESPKVHARRDENGRLSIDPAASDPNAPKPNAAENGWAQTLQYVLQAAKQRAEEEAKERAQAKKQPDEKSGEKGDSSAKTSTPNSPSISTPDAPHAKTPPPTTPVERLEHGIPGVNPDLAAPPRVVVKHVIVNGLEVDASEPKGGAPGFALQDGDLHELADDRLAHGQPATAHVKGSVTDAQKRAIGAIELALTLEPPSDQGSRWKLSIALSELDLASADPWLASICPIRFEKGKAKLTLDASGLGLSGPLEAAPRIELTELSAKPRGDPRQRVLGVFEAEQVAREVTAAGAFALTDVKVTGSVVEPRVEMGETIKQLVLQGGERFAKQKATEAADKAIDKAADKAKQKLGDKGGDAAKGLLEKGKSLFGGDGK